MSVIYLNSNSGGTSDNECVIAEWDFTNSLIDKINNLEITLSNATRDITGLHLTSSNSKAVCPNTVTLSTNFFIEMEFGDISSNIPSGKHAGILTWLTPNVNTNYGFMYRSTGVFSLYSIVRNQWADSNVSNINALKNAKVKYVVLNNTIQRVYVNDVQILSAQALSSFSAYYYKNITIGNAYDTSGNVSLYDMIVKSMRIGYFNSLKLI